MTRSRLFTRISCIGAMGAVMVLTACNRTPAPEVNLVPTRTLAPRATAVAAPAVTQAPESQAATPPSRKITGLTTKNASDLAPVFSLNEPPPQHIYSVADDRLTIYNTRSFQTVNRESLETTQNTQVQLRDAAGRGFWYAASPNGKVGAIMQLDGTVDIYDLDTGKISQTLSVPEPSFDVSSDIALNDDGSELVAVVQGEVRRVRLSDGEIVGAAQKLPLTSTAIRFSENAARIAAIQATGEIVIVNVKSGAPAITLTEVFTGATVVRFNFSPNGDKVWRVQRQCPARVGSE